jgi:hypothetical protein
MLKIVNNLITLYKKIKIALKNQFNNIENKIIN